MYFGHSNLFRVSIFGFRNSLHRKVGYNASNNAILYLAVNRHRIYETEDEVTRPIIRSFKSRNRAFHSGITSIRTSPFE